MFRGNICLVKISRKQTFFSISHMHVVFGDKMCVHKKEIS